jgi:hypothetical protein
MTKSSAKWTREAVRRAEAAARNARRKGVVDEREHLVQVEAVLIRTRNAAGALGDGERAVALALVRRDRAVRDARALGVSWATLAAAAGSSRQALMKRVGGG